MPLCSVAQKKVGMEQYYYMQTKSLGTIVPKINYQCAKNWYGELRYNYEELKTASVHFGRKIEIEKLNGLEIVPLAGVCFGHLNGGSLGALAEISFNRLSFFSEPQYVFSFHDKEENYFYSWSEVVYEITPSFYSGLALQHTKMPSQAGFVEPGVVSGVSIGSFDLPFYCFSPFGAERNFVIGVNWKWQDK